MENIGNILSPMNNFHITGYDDLKQQQQKQEKKPELKYFPNSHIFSYFIYSHVVIIVYPLP